jgi:Domain of unknown function (DUF1707)
MGARETKEGPDMGDLEPRMRAGDTDRAKVVETLGRHLGEGRLTVEEFDERVTRAHAAVHLDELPPLLVDLPSERPVPPRPAGPPRWVPSAALVVLVALVLASSVVAVVHGAPPVFAFLLLFVVLRHRRWSRRW